MLVVHITSIKSVHASYIDGADYHVGKLYLEN